MIPALPGIFGSILSGQEISLTIESGEGNSSIERTHPEKRNFLKMYLIPKRKKEESSFFGKKKQNLVKEETFAFNQLRKPLTFPPAATSQQNYDFGQNPQF